jgi:hypothetical protein
MVKVMVGLAVVAAAVASVTLVTQGTSHTTHSQASRNPSASQPMVRYNQFVGALNRGDVAAATALFGPDSYIVTPLCVPWCADTTAIAGDFAADAAIHSKITFTDPRVRGTILTSRITLTAPQLPGGAQRAVGLNTVQTYRGHIVLLRADFDRTDPQTATFLRALGK